MPEVVADFTGKILLKELDQIKPVRGRVLLNREQLVLVTEPVKKTIPLSEIVSVHAGSIDQKLAVFFDDVINVISKRGDTICRAIIGTNAETLTKFVRVLFMILIGEETVLTKHPTKKGGRVVNTDAEKMMLRLSGAKIEFINNNRKDSIPNNRIIGFRHVEDKIRGKARPTLVLDYAAGETTLTSTISLLSKRKLKLLSRFARINYDKTNRNLNMSDLTETEMWFLIQLYAEERTTILSKMVEGGENHRDDIKIEVEEEQLIEEGRGGLRLTHKGKVAVHRYYAN
jgi:helix-turn-helix protein